ncbi:MAG TPA: hypothetical protein VD966_00855 [Pyrinomonadaceae bacterium]|nr:hypothetical protein [Pyrinomonadaceae bacterium]
MERPLFESFLMGGFECSTHRLRTGKRLDMIAATAHDKFAAADYLRLQEQGMRTARDGIRWHLIERTPGDYDFSSVLPMLRAARETGMQVIWDLCHYGWPDHLDIFKPDFVRHFAGLARAFTKMHASETDAVPFISPVNEISFFSWGAGQVGYLNPFAEGRGDELKAQLVRAAIEAIEAIWDVNPQARIVHTDPIINVVADPARPEDRAAAESYRLSQFAAWDMLSGRLSPQLGGQEKYLDIIGVNYYVHNQWILDGPFIKRSNPQHRPLREMIREVYERYRRPVFMAETGIENKARRGWLRYVGREVRAAMKAGVPLEGLCLYPIVNHPGWDDERHCHNGLWDYPDELGNREIYRPLAQELQRQRRLVERMQQQCVPA